GDLVSRLVRSTRALGQLVGRAHVARTRLELLAVHPERLLQRLRLHELLEGHAVGPEVVLPAAGEGGNLVPAPGEEEAEHLLHPEPLEELDAARAQARAL